MIRRARPTRLTDFRGSPANDFTLDTSMHSADTSVSASIRKRLQYTPLQGIRRTRSVQDRTHARPNASVRRVLAKRDDDDDDGIAFIAGSRYFCEDRWKNTTRRVREGGRCGIASPGSACLIFLLPFSSPRICPPKRGRRSRSQTVEERWRWAYLSSCRVARVADHRYHRRGPRPEASAVATYVMSG